MTSISSMNNMVVNQSAVITNQLRIIEEQEFTIEKQIKTIEKYQDIIEAKDWFINQIELDIGEAEFESEKMILSNHEIKRELERTIEYYDDSLDSEERNIKMKDMILMAKDLHIQALLTKITKMTEDHAEEMQIKQASVEIQIDIAAENENEVNNLRAMLKEQYFVVNDLEHKLMCANDAIDTMEHLQIMVREQSDLFKDMIAA
jgi:hypothetical protein